MKFQTPTRIDIELSDFLTDNLKPGMEVYVGTDSKPSPDPKYVTAVCIYNPGKGGNFIISSCRNGKRVSMRDRLLHEAYLSIECAMEISKMIGSEYPLTIHIDANQPHLNWESGKHAKGLIGYVKGCGFNCDIKPNSWCASSIADDFTSF